MLRKKNAHRKLREGALRLRGHDIYRIETFSDAVFAFALTLLVVSLEVPKSFIELERIIKGFPAFFIGALFLYMVWNEQNKFFRHYGMKDPTTDKLNAVLLFVVLFYVYPLKFLFSLLFSNNEYEVNGKILPRIESYQQNAELLLVYAAGFIMVYVMFALLYAHALRKKDEIQLNDIEIFQTKTFMYSRLWMVAVGLLSVLITLTGVPGLQAYAGFCYILIWPVLARYFSYRFKKMKKQIGEEEILKYEQLLRH
jgi:uncharacterized membrane protein